MKSIVITSGKGGVGKTTVAACLGIALSALGFRVVLIDADFGLNNLDVLLNMENKVVYDVKDVIDNRCRVRQALVECTHNLFLLPSAHGYLGENVTAQNIKLILKSLSVTFDYVLVDCPAGIEAGFKRAVIPCDKALVVTTPHLSALRDASKVINLLGSYRFTPTLVVNRVRGDLLAVGKIPSADEISAILGAEIDGIIPESDRAADPFEMTDKPFVLLARKIAFGEMETVDPAQRYRGLLGAIRRKLRKDK